jgi:hypothetical protein
MFLRFCDCCVLPLCILQSVWDPVVLATPNASIAKKRFLSRTGRYTGLQNILQFETVDLTNTTQLATLLEGSNAWIAYDVAKESISSFSSVALESKVKRAIFTTNVGQEVAGSTTVPEFEAAVIEFEKQGASFLGIRHGTIISGTEDNAYEIVNATEPVTNAEIERGVLARVTAELLRSGKAQNKICGLGSAGGFAEAYLDVLRQSGLTRQQEVEKMFTGGLQRVAQLTVNEYEAEKKRAQEKQERIDREKVSASPLSE